MVRSVSGSDPIRRVRRRVFGHLAVPIRQLDLVVARWADRANVDGHVSAGLGLKFCERPDGQRPGLRLVRRVDDDMEGQRGDVKSGRSRSPLI